MWEALDAGEPPYPLDVPVHGATEDERAALRRQVHADPPDPRVREWLGVLAMARQSIDSVFLPEPGAEPVRALAAAGASASDSASANASVLAVQRGPGLELRPIEHGALVSAIVDLLPDTPRGTERSVSVPAEEFTPTPGLRGGQLAANGRDRFGGRRRSPVLAWCDTETGRYLGHIRPAPDGRRWTTVYPADAATLRARITELLDGVLDGRR